METKANNFPGSFEEAKANALADPLANKMNKVSNMIELEKNATQAAENGATPFELSKMIGDGRNAISAVYPDIPEYEKAVSAASRFKANRAADNPQDTIDEMPDFI